MRLRPLPSEMERNILKKRIKKLATIAIVGSLSIILLMVIDPARQIKKAKQTMFRVNAEKGCSAFLVCTGSSQTAINCSGNTNAAALTRIGFIIPKIPVGASYLITPLLPVPPGAVLTFTSTYDTCVFTCSAAPRNGSVSKFALTSKGASCIIL